ncbi:MAG: methionine synthase [Candidatus Zixiibacteriota bacterium]|nr:MAG: methionine synthase [candidate division Zixibacteria bacterium]
MLRYLPQIPTWPQLPNAGYLESMYLQYSGGMPFVTLDPAKERLFMDLRGDIWADLERFYERVLEDDLEWFAITPQYASGLHAFIGRLWRTRPPELVMVKGQVTGPISFGLMITDERKRSVLYREEVFDAVLKSLALKARWQARQLQRLHPQVLMFIDEPYLSSFGSAFINLSRDQVLQYLEEVVSAIHQEGALAGVHCCGNTDWSILMDTELDVINFDAYEYFQGMTLYLDRLQAFLKRGGVLAWGIVPTNPQIAQGSAETLRRKFLEQVADLEGRGIDREVLLRQSLLTPSCGMGSLSVETAGLVLQRLAEVSQAVRADLSAAPPKGKRAKTRASA